MLNALKIISGNGNLPLAQRISQYCGIPLTECEIGRYSDGEVKVQINQNIRGSDLFIVQPTNSPAENMLELLIMIDAMKRASWASESNCSVPAVRRQRKSTRT